MTNTNPDKAREWWIYHNKKQSGWSDVYDHEVKEYGSADLHLVDKSAYETIKAERDSLRADLKTAREALKEIFVSARRNDKGRTQYFTSDYEYILKLAREALELVVSSGHCEKATTIFQKAQEALAKIKPAGKT